MHVTKTLGISTETSLIINKDLYHQRLGEKYL